MRMHMHVHAHIHINVHVHIHKHMHAHVHANTCMHKIVDTHSHAHRRMRAHKDTRADTYPYTRNAHIHTLDSMIQDMITSPSTPCQHYSTAYNEGVCLCKLMLLGYLLEYTMLYVESSVELFIGALCIELVGNRAVYCTLDLARGLNR